MQTSLRERLDAIVAEYDLLNHPFYQAWSAGTLPVEALTTYAEEYGAFISRVPAGWDAHGDTAIAEEERAHAVLWNTFANAVGTQIGEAKLPAVKGLVSTVDKHFASATSSLGSLYAFEAQQPHTSKSKLDGLTTHYTQLHSDVKPYFAIHVDDIHEPALLLERMEALTGGDQEIAVEACRETAKALWDALTDIHEKHCVSEINA